MAKYKLYFKKTGGKIYFYLKNVYFTKNSPDNCIQIKKLDIL